MRYRSFVEYIFFLLTKIPDRISSIEFCISRAAVGWNTYIWMFVPDDSNGSYTSTTHTSTQTSLLLDKGPAR